MKTDTHFFFDEANVKMPSLCGIAKGDAGEKFHWATDFKGANKLSLKLVAQTVKTLVIMSKVR